MYLDDLYVGMELEIPEVTIDREQMMDFARLYDPLPLHLDEDYAKNTRFSGMIAPGVMSFMSVWAEFVKMRVFADELIAGKSTKIEWFLPVYPGDRLRGQLTISRIEKRNVHNGIAETTLMVYNQRHELVLSNVTESVVRYRET